MTEAIYLEVTEKVQEAKDKKRRVSVSGMLAHLGVSRSGYNAWLHRMPSNQQKRKEAVQKKIQDIYDQSYQNYGAPKITEKLRQEGETIAERTVGKYMKELGIKAQWVKHYTITTKDSDFSSELKNILNEQFNPNRPNAVWCSDITYIWTIDGFVYLTSIMDLYSRKIIAWTLSKTLEVSCVIDTINKAKTRRNIDSPLIIHSDRGSQYVSKEYRKATEKMQLSYSKKAFPWDNACIESFHSIIKRE
jgi:transposase InsO family protein